jgi:hypothetical protein
MKEIRRKGSKQVFAWFLIIIFLHGESKIPHETTQTSPAWSV